MSALLALVSTRALCSPVSSASPVRTSASSSDRASCSASFSWAALSV